MITMKEPEVMAQRTLEEWLLEEIDQRRTSVRQFAKDAGVSYETLNQILSANRPPDAYPSMKTLIRLSEYTRIDLCTLVGMIAPSRTHLDAESLLLVQRIQRLNPDQRKVVETFIAGTVLKKGD